MRLKEVFGECSTWEVRCRRERVVDPPLHLLYPLLAIFHTPSLSLCNEGFPSPSLPSLPPE